MTTSHILEYSKSGKATCHGPPPCKGSTIPLGALRYGTVTQTEFGQSVEWRHWGCVTPDMLAQIASQKPDRIAGFNDLKSEDQAKVRLAVGLRRIDPVDVPASAKASIAGVSGTNSRKRKLPEVAAGPSRSAGPSSFRQVDEHEHEDVASEDSVDELYCVLETNIVGVQYYHGMVGSGEEVSLVREPRNKYDRNAIQVKNIGNVQVGHIPRGIAEKLAPLMDSGAVTVEGVMREGNLTGFSYSLAMTVKIYGPSGKRAELEPKLVWATPGQRGFSTRTGSGSHPVPGAPSTPAKPTIVPPSAMSSRIPMLSQAPTVPSTSYGQRSAQTAAQMAAYAEAQRKQYEAWQKAAELKQMLSTLEKVDDEDRRGSLLDTLCSVDDVLGLPVHPSPPGIENGQLKVNLLKHQLQGLQWCIEREYPVLPKTEEDKPVQFWQLKKAQGKTFYYNIATKTPQQAPPVLGKGALCADSMGLGKTLTMLSLILATKSDNPVGFSKTTLIVVPLSVLSNWEKQIEDHVTPGILTSCVYYGTSRTMTPAQLKEYDIVLTTYQTVTGEHDDKDGEPKSKKRKTQKALFGMQWKRIILDEGHNIRNSKTKMAKSVYALNAERRWVLTGTPIINSPKDLGSILTFLKICHPLDNEEYYNRMVLRPLKDGDPSGAELLRALMSQICIRRTKEMQDSEGNYLVPLPPVEMTLIPVALTDEARELYDAVDEISRERVDSLVTGEGGLGSAAVRSNVLSMLTRLRQLALHPGLLPPNYLEQLRVAADQDDEAPTAIHITPRDKARLQAILAQGIEDNEECPVCFDILNEPRITGCAHMFCLACITEVITRDAKCPMDRRPLGLQDLVEPPPPTELTQAPVPLDENDDNSSTLRSGSSAKIDQLIHLLKLTPETEKSLVFSQFTSFLDKIAETLEKEGIPFVRFDGQMSAKRRQETLARFSIPIREQDLHIVPQSQPDTLSGRARRKSSRGISYTQEGVMDVDNGDDPDFTFVGDEDDADDFVDENPGQKKTKKGKGKAKAKSARSTTASSGDYKNGGFDGVNPKVMLISLKAGALGLNLTVANNVYLMDPWWQEGIESQAIDRCNRIGQTKPVHVYQLIAENTVESKVIDIQEKKKKLIKEAFSGIKSKETQRQKKEARLQELVELFGIRRQASTQQATSNQSTLDSSSRP